MNSATTTPQKGWIRVVPAGSAGPAAAAIVSFQEYPILFPVGSVARLVIRLKLAGTRSFAWEQT
jgi:hypothetical protein